MSNFPDAKILIVEDEKNLGITLKEYLEGLGAKCELATNINDAQEYFDNNTYDVILMDIGLPDGSGLDLAKLMRSKRKDFVLFFLSAQNDPETKVEGLEIGAEDYITKPFALKELVLRLDKVFAFKNMNKTIPDEINFGPLTIWFKRYELKDANNNILSLGQKEAGILRLLYENKNNAVDRDIIIQKIWGEDKFPSNRTVDNYIVKLRKWAETDINSTVEIKSIRGVGYKLILNQ